MTTEADYVFVPEMPPPLNWPAILKDKITTVSYILSFRDYSQSSLVIHKKNVEINFRENRALVKR